MTSWFEPTSWKAKEGKERCVIPRKSLGPSASAELGRNDVRIRGLGVLTRKEYMNPHCQVEILIVNTLESRFHTER